MLKRIQHILKQGMNKFRAERRAKKGGEEKFWTNDLFLVIGSIFWRKLLILDENWLKKSKNSKKVLHDLFLNNRLFEPAKSSKIFCPLKETQIFGKIFNSAARFFFGNFLYLSHDISCHQIFPIRTPCNRRNRTSMLENFRFDKASIFDNEVNTDFCVLKKFTD